MKQKQEEEKVWCPRCQKEVVTRREAFPRVVATAAVGWIILVWVFWYATEDAFYTALGGVFLLLMLAAVVIVIGSALPKSCPECGMPESEMRRSAEKDKVRLEKKRKD